MARDVCPPSCPGASLPAMDHVDYHLDLAAKAARRAMIAASLSVVFALITIGLVVWTWLP